MNLLDDVVWRMVLGWAHSQIIGAAWFGTPCDTWTRARRAPPESRMPGPLRSSEHLYGLPGLSASGRRKAQEANMISARASHLQAVLLRQSVPFGEENPATSMLWLRPDRENIRHEAHIYFVDYCAFGRPFRGRTQLRLFNCIWSPELARARCSGRGTCSFSGRLHETLSGRGKSGFHTSRKNSYPEGLCDVLALILQNGLLRKKVASLWSTFRAIPTS